MDIKEIALKVADSLRNKVDGISHMQSNQGLASFAEALISAYKTDLLKEAGEPVAYMTTDEDGSASMLFFDRAEALKYSGDDEPVNLFAESQLQAAQEELNQCSGLLDDSLRSIEMLEDQLATAEQRVAEAVGLFCDNYGQKTPKYRHGQVERTVADDIAACVRSGEWRKYMKEV